MEISNPVTAQETPWNRGKLVGQKPPLRLKEIWAIRIRLQLAKRAGDPVATWINLITPLIASHPQQRLVHEYRFDASGATPHLRQIRRGRDAVPY